MPELATPMEETAQQQVDRLGTADFVVGVASQDNAETIGPVVQSALAGLQQTFPAGRFAIIHADAGSRDNTTEGVRQSIPAEALVQLQVSPAGTPRLNGAPTGRAGALRAIFDIALRLSARGCAVLEADLTSVNPERVIALLAPVAEGRADYVLPYYTRHRFAGAISTSVIYPLIRALYGQRVRYPVAGEFAGSAPLLQKLLNTSSTQSGLPGLGGDVWLTAQALALGFRTRQINLGIKTQAASEPSDLSGTLSQVLGELFQQMERTAAQWQKVRGSQPVPLERAGPAQRPDELTVDAQRLLDAFRLGQQNLAEIWGAALPPMALLELSKMGRRTDAEFRFADALWARIIYDFAIAYRTRVMNRDHLLAAFTPLYSGWLGGYIGEMESASETEVEHRIEQLCLQFEAEKPYLISRWRWPDRFNP